MPKSDQIYYSDGTFDWSLGVDSSLVTTLRSALNSSGLNRNQLAWMNNSTVRGGGITMRAGWQQLGKLLDAGRWQGGYIYEPDTGLPYLVCSISGHIYKMLLEDPFTVTDLSIQTYPAPPTAPAVYNVTLLYGGLGPSPGTSVAAGEVLGAVTLAAFVVPPIGSTVVVATVPTHYTGDVGIMYAPSVGGSWWIMSKSLATPLPTVTLRNTQIGYGSGSQIVTKLPYHGVTLWPFVVPPYGYDVTITTESLFPYPQGTTLSAANGNYLPPASSWLVMAVNDPSTSIGLVNPDWPEKAFFTQGENYLIIQAGDYGQVQTPTLPLFWDGAILRRSIGIITVNPPPAMLPNINEIPAATCMDYYGGRIWYAQNRQYSAGDMVGGPSGNVYYHYRDAILSVTENPLCVGGDGFTVPSNAGNIRAIKHSAAINASLGQGQLFIFTRKSIYQLTVPITRTQWIAANNSNQPEQKVVQITNGATGDRCVVAVNGDLFYQSFDPAIRSLTNAVRNFDMWGNTPISQNELRALQGNDRALMRFSSAIEFDNRLFNLVLPRLSADGINVVHDAILPLDFDVVTNLAERKSPVWEGAYDGLQFVQLFAGDFGGNYRAFAVALSEVDGSINVWEMSRFDRTENGDNRVTMSIETPAYTWGNAGLETKLKRLNGGELWLDRIFGQVDIHVYYRVDADPCWRLWTLASVCAARNCADQDPVKVCYPEEPACEGYRWAIGLPQPQVACDTVGIRPATIGYQFQMKLVIKGFCRIRGIILYALLHAEPQFHNVLCPPAAMPRGMAKLPNLLEQ